MGKNRREQHPHSVSVFVSAPNQIGDPASDDDLLRPDLDTDLEMRLIDPDRFSHVVFDSSAVTLEAPQSADVSEIVDVFDAAFEEVEVVAKREREQAVQTATEFRKDVAAQLTEKQRAALEAAYAAGYYQWPREVTAEELAESMGISSSTLHQHLRYGVQSLAEAFFQEPRRERAPES